MATQSNISSLLPDSRLNEDDYPAFKSHFSPAVRRALIDDDLSAGRWVPILLASLISFGVTLALLGVWLTY